MKFSDEYIQKQKELIASASPTPWERCSCRKCTSVCSIPIDAEVLFTETHIPGCEEEGFPYSKKYSEDTDLIVEAVNNWGPALEYIQHIREGYLGLTRAILRLKKELGDDGRYAICLANGDKMDIGSYFHMGFILEDINKHLPDTGEE